jgi:hypothetical protein
MALILRTFLSLAAGFAVMALLIGLASAVARKLVPSWSDNERQLTSGYIIFNVGFSFVAAMTGGYVTAWIAESNPLIQTLALALIVLLIGALGALQLRGRQPIGYALLLVASTPVGVVLGGWIRLKVTGLL